MSGALQLIIATSVFAGVLIVFVLGRAVLGAAHQILLDEFLSLPALLTRRLITRYAERLPVDLVERYKAEWLAEVDAAYRDRKLSGLWYALRLKKAVAQLIHDHAAASALSGAGNPDTTERAVSSYGFVMDFDGTVLVADWGTLSPEQIAEAVAHARAATFVRCFPLGKFSPPVSLSGLITADGGHFQARRVEPDSTAE